MRKLVVSIHSTANFVVTGPPSGDETDFMTWAQPGIDESSATFLTYLDNVDTVLLGRGTYEDLVRKWPAVTQWPDVPEVALRIGELVNGAQKFVVSDTLAADSLAWGEHEPPTLIPGTEVLERIAELKSRDGGDIITFGSPVLVQTLTNAGLVDEFKIMVHPVIVAEGRRLFDGLDRRTDLRLAGIDTFEGGAMTVTYEVRSSV